MSEPTETECPLIELRQYTHHPGTRETLIDLFEDHFLDVHLSLGMHAPGIFRDLDRPERFAWLRGFESEAARGPALTAFYQHPDWLERRDAANATMIDWDDVLLLRPVPGTGLRFPCANPPVGAPPPDTRVQATLLRLRRPADRALLQLVAERVAPLLGTTGAPLVACYVSAGLANDYPRLPIRADPVLLWLTRFPSGAALESHRAALRNAPAWPALEQALAQLCTAPLQHLTLQPTGRSPLGQPVTHEEDPMNRLFAAALLAASAAVAAPEHAPAASSSTAQPGVEAELQQARAGRYSLHDFDFLVGAAWQVKHRRLLHRGVGSSEWEEFPGSCSGLVQHLGGVVNVDESLFPTKGWSGMSLRTFSPETGRWKIYWINSRSGDLLPPVEGGFTGTRGAFYGVDDDGGRPVQVRFLWTVLGKDRARWEQAFSYAGGPWETNWVMEFSRP